MRMAFQKTCIGNADKLCISAEIINGLCTAVAHACTKAAEHLEDRISQNALVGNTAFDAFRHQFLGIFLELAVLGSFCHRSHGTHAAIDFEGTSLIDFNGTGRFFCAGKQAAQHHAGTACGQCLHDVTGILDAAVGDDADAMLVRLFRTISNGRDLRHTNAGHHTGRTDGTGANANLDTVNTG